MLLEKVWAKTVGSYYATVGGTTDELFSFIGGAPNEKFYTQ